MIIDVADPLRGLRAYPIKEVWACIEKIRGAGGPARQSRRGTCVTPSGNYWRGRRRSGRTPTSAPRQHRRLQATTGSSTRLSSSRDCARSAPCVGFTRLSAPDREELRPAKRVPLTRGRTEWVPAVEQRGEGIFLQLREDMVARGWPRLTSLSTSCGCASRTGSGRSTGRRPRRRTSRSRGSR